MVVHLDKLQFDLESKPSLILGLGVGSSRGGRGRSADGVAAAGRVHRIARERRRFVRATRLRRAGRHMNMSEDRRAGEPWCPSTRTSFVLLVDGCHVVIVVISFFLRDRQRVSFLFRLPIALEIKSGTKVKKLQRQFLFLHVIAYFCIEKQKII